MHLFGLKIIFFCDNDPASYSIVMRIVQTEKHTHTKN